MKGEFGKREFTEKDMEPNDRFPLGKLVQTQGVVAWSLSQPDLEKAIRKVARCVAAHARGDWGDLGDFDKQQNEEALDDEDNPGRILSKYWLDTDTKIYIITEYDRSVTTVMLCEEY